MPEVQKIDLINSIVKTQREGSSIDMTGIVPFMYPSFLVKDEIFFDYDNSVIYMGPYSSRLKEELSHGTREFIAISNKGISDYDLTDRETCINIIYSKWNKRISEVTHEALINMDDREFLDYYKKFWVTGRSTIEEKDVSLFSLYKVLGKQRHDILKVYFELIETYSDSTIFSSVLSFIEKSLNPDTVSSNSGLYIKMLNDFKREYGQKAVQVIQKAYTMRSQTDSDLRYRNLFVLMQLGKGNIL